MNAEDEAQLWGLVRALRYLADQRKAEDGKPKTGEVWPRLDHLQRELESELNESDGAA